MDFFGLIWLISALVLFPFGYKPMIVLLSLSSIFNASQIVELGGTNIPLFFGLEIITILRFLLPYNNSGILKFSDQKSFQVLSLIICLWIYTYLVANFFSGMSVYAGYADSFEQNYYAKGLPLVWGKSNVNFLVYMSIHLILALIFYKRKAIISKEFYLKCILSSVVLFNIVGLLWLFKISWYEDLCLLMFNNPKFSIALYNGDPRFQATFTEPSVAGLFIAVFAMPCVLNERIFLKIMGGMLLVFAGFNISSTVLIGLLLSILVLYLYFFRSTYRYLFATASVALLLLILSLSFLDDFIYYYDQKNMSDSGLIRSDSNIRTLGNFFESYMFGLGVGSVKSSSLFICYIANFGIVFGSLFIYMIYKLIDFSRDVTSKIILCLLTIALAVSMVSIPDYNLALIWNIIFATICVSQSSKKGIN